jgi:hypothetical protein
VEEVEGMNQFKRVVVKVGKAHIRLQLLSTRASQCLEVII